MVMVARHAGGFAGQPSDAVRTGNLVKTLLPARCPMAKDAGQVLVQRAAGARR